MLLELPHNRISREQRTVKIKGDNRLICSHDGYYASCYAFTCQRLKRSDPALRQMMSTISLEFLQRTEVILTVSLCPYPEKP